MCSLISYLPCCSPYPISLAVCIGEKSERGKNVSPSTFVLSFGLWSLAWAEYGLVSTFWNRLLHMCYWLTMRKHILTYLYEQLRIAYLLKRNLRLHFSLMSESKILLRFWKIQVKCVKKSGERIAWVFHLHFRKSLTPLLNFKKYLSQRKSKEAVHKMQKVGKRGPAVLSLILSLFSHQNNRFHLNEWMFPCHKFPPGISFWL